MMDRFREIRLFETESGKSPVADYISGIKKPRDRATIVKTLEAVQSLNHLPGSMLKKFKGRSGLWEIKVREHRFLGFYPPIGGVPVFLLVHAFKKESNSTPAYHTELAERRQCAYLQRLKP